MSKQKPDDFMVIGFCIFAPNKTIVIIQKTITLPSYPRGFHLITRLIEQQLHPLPITGLVHLFIQHTSAGLTLNENADPTVRIDFEHIFDSMIPDGKTQYHHNSEGADDMPAHLKSTLTGSSVSIPISNGQLNLGMWQGIYLCEFRNIGGSRRIVATVIS